MKSMSKTTNKVLVSIIVPIYNVAPYLDKCIDSAIAQSYSDIEIILVDDGSTDLSGEIIDSYARRDDRIKIIHKENGGLVSARKAGISASKGKYIFYLDGDDSIELNYIKELATIAEKENADVVISMSTYARKGLLKAVIPTGVYKAEEQRKFLYENMISSKGFYSFGVMPFLCGKLFRRDIILPLQLQVDERIKVGEDVACIYPVILTSQCVVIARLDGYIYRERAGSLSSNNLETPDESIEHLAFRYRFMKKTYEKMSQNTEAIIRQLKEYAYFALLTKFPQLLFSDKEKRFLPYDIKTGDHIIIYGAGMFGKKIRDLLERNGYTNILYSIDRDAYPNKGAEPIISILSERYDKIIIATLHKDMAYEMEDCLENLGIEKEKITSVKLDAGICEYVNEMLEKRL